jgi:hypothetical protein
MAISSAMKSHQCSKGELSQPFVPSKDWINALEAQCTEEMLQLARRYASRRARGVGYVNDDYHASELVQDALTDTTIGVLRWDPSVKPLQQHIHDVIKVRTNHDRKRAQRFPHESIDVLDSDGEATTLAEVEATLLERSTEPPDDPVALAAERLAKLRQLAAGDRTVLRLINAFARGADSKADALRVAELSSVAYDNARRRLRRLVTQLSSPPSRTDTSPQKENEHATR